MDVITGELGGDTGIVTGAGNALSLATNDSNVLGAYQGQDKPEIRPSQLPPETLFNVLKRWWQADAEHAEVWRQNAKRWYEFRSGEQWSAEDRALLADQQRPVIVFNRVLTVLKAVAGMEINGRHEVTFIPRGTEDTAVNEMLSAASKWMSDGCDAEDEESSAFEDTATCGMGWTENRMDYQDHWKGKYIEERVSPFEMYWDRTAWKKNLTDARRVSRVRKMALRDAMAMFPGKTRSELDATWAIDAIQGATKTLEEKRKREENTTEDTYDDMIEVTIVHMQWQEREFYWKVANLQNGTISELKDDEYRVFQQRSRQLGMEQMVEAVRLPRLVYKQAFMGGAMLQQGDSPVNDFIWKCITGELDFVHKTWFGLVKIMEDPQRWSNKWLSQVLHILNSTAKGGILAEEDVPAGDVREFEEKYARPDAVTWVARGAIGNQKIMPKPGQGFSEGHVQLMQYAISSIRDTTGINLELLGQQDQNQPGILEAARKQAGMTILATLFDSLRRFRKQIGRIRLQYLQKYMADGRLVRVVGPGGAQALPLLRDKCLGDYDTVVDDAPTSPNVKEANWAIIMPLIGAFRDQLVANPQVLVALLEYSPLPSRVVEMLKQFAAASQQDPEQQQIKQLNIAKIVAGINKDQSTAEMQLAKAGASEATAIYDVSMARHLLEKGDYDKLAMHLDGLAKQQDLQKSQAQAEQAKAGAMASMFKAHADARQSNLDVAKTHADIVKTHADATKSHADARAAYISALIEALTAGQQPEAKDEQKKPEPPPLPVHARQAPDGRHYVPDPKRPGKYLMLVPKMKAA